MDADICVFEDSHEWVVGREELLFRNKVSPYTGKTMKGRVKETWVRGVKVYERGVGVENGMVVRKEGPVGRLLLERRVV